MKYILKDVDLKIKNKKIYINNNKIVKKKTYLICECLSCNKKYETLITTFLKRNQLCGECVKKRNIIKKYGVDSIFKTEKLKNSIFNKYGVKNASQLDSVKKKRKENSIRKYGKSNPCSTIQSIECSELGIKLIHVFEDDWIFNSNLVKERILNPHFTFKKSNIRKWFIHKDKRSLNFSEMYICDSGENWLDD